jgi:hypothetical protein
LTEKQIVSRQRVADHGEVFTSQREVNAMLDLVKQETERIESRFLEPACGTGNFLTEILRRKLAVVKRRYAKSQLDYEIYAFTAIASIYGIDLLEDNTIRCRERLFEIFDEEYSKLYKTKARGYIRDAIRYALQVNIILGDALTLKSTAGEDIAFAEWSVVGGRIKRKDYTYNELLGNNEVRAEPLFSDLGEELYLPEPVRDFPLQTLEEIANEWTELQTRHPELPCQSEQ